MEDYPGNSRKARETKVPEEAKKVEKVISGEVVRKKKPLRKRVYATIFGGEDAGGVWGYILNDVLLPAAKDTISDAVSQGVERMLFSEVSTRRNSLRSRGGSSPYTAYNRVTSTSPVHRREDPRRELSRRARVTHNFDEIELQTRAEAEDVLDHMMVLLEKYDFVTVADLYDLVGQTSGYTDVKFGWTDLRDARAVRTKGGYLLDLPRTETFD